MNEILFYNRIRRCYRPPMGPPMKGGASPPCTGPKSSFFLEQGSAIKGKFSFGTVHCAVYHNGPAVPIASFSCICKSLSQWNSALSFRLVTQSVSWLFLKTANDHKALSKTKSSFYSPKPIMGQTAHCASTSRGRRGCVCCSTGVFQPAGSHHKYSS